MSPVTHFLTGWVIANSTALGRRERALVTLAAVVPDIDGFGAIPELLTRNTAHPLLWFSRYHHALHNVFFALMVTVVALTVAKTRRWLTAGLVLLTFHVHLLEDLAGARGPDGDPWPLPYFVPLSHAEWTWSGQWALNAWPNLVLTLVLLAMMFYIAWKRGRSPLEMVS